MAKDNEAKKNSLSLAYPEKSAKQLAHGARMHSARSAMFTTAELNGAYKRSKKWHEEHKTAEQDYFFSCFNDCDDFCFQCEEYGELTCCQGKDCKKAYCLQCAGSDCTKDMPETDWRGSCCEKS